MTLVNNAVLGRSMENVRKHRDSKLVTTEARRNYLVSEPDYNATEISISNRNEKNSNNYE